MVTARMSSTLADNEEDSLYRVFTSEPCGARSFCSDCKEVTLVHLLGRVTTPSKKYSGFRLPKVFGAIARDATFCKLCYVITFSIKLSGLWPPLSAELFLVPMRHWAVNLRTEHKETFDGFRIFELDQKRIQSSWLQPESLRGQDLDELGQGYGYLKCVSMPDNHIEDSNRSSTSYGLEGGRVVNDPGDRHKSESIDSVGQHEREARANAQKDSGMPVKIRWTSSSIPVSSLVNAWLQTCDTEHEVCKQRSHFVSANRDTTTRSSIYAPKRLLEIFNQSQSLKFRLHETSARKYQYVALSHCWGTSAVLKTTLSTLSAHKVGISTSDLPHTFIDAARLALAIGCHYLWIDSLCIIQDDVNDWSAESPHMDEVYAGAYLTILAASSESSAGGCLARKPAWKDCVQLPFDHDTDGSGSRVWLLPYPASAGRWSFRNHPLQQRGWTLQELLLSRRVLYCAGHEYVWLCPQAQASTCDSDLQLHETWETPMKNMFLARSFRSPQEAYLAWRNSVIEYSGRNLTFRDDKLMAIQGLARSLAAHIPGTYAFGIWECTLPLALTWRYGTHSQQELDDEYGDVTEFARLSYSPAETAKQVAVRHRAPTWSWASVDGFIVSDVFDFDPDESLLEGLSCAGTFRLPEDPVWDVQATFVTAEGQEGEKSEDFGPLAGPRLISLTCKMLKVNFSIVGSDACHDEQEATEESISNVPYLRWLTADGLIVNDNNTLVYMDDPQFPHHEPEGGSYLAVIFCDDFWMLISKAATASHHARIGALDHSVLLATLNGEGTEEDRSTAFSERLRQLEKLAVKDTIHLG